jgi:uncharacterized ion transporter superfamily protein YfcC
MQSIVNQVTEKSIRWLSDTTTETIIVKDDNNSTINTTFVEDFDAPEEEHDTDAYSTTILTLTLICCLLLAYYVKQHRLYFLPESAGALLIGVVVGGIARLVTNKEATLQFFEFVSITLVVV